MIKQNFWLVLFVIMYNPLAAAELQISKAVKQWEQTAEVNRVIFSPDGRWLVSATNDNTVKVWHVQSGELQHNLQGHPSQVKLIAFSPNSEWLATVDSDNFIKLWAMSTGLVRHNFVYQVPISSIAFSSNNLWLAVGSLDGQVKLWGLESGWVQHVLYHEGGVSSLAFSNKNGALLLASGGNRYVNVWNLDSGEWRYRFDFKEFDKEYAYVSSITFSPNGALLASGGEKYVKVWELQSGQLRYSLRNNPGHLVKFSPNGRWLVSSLYGKLNVWQAESGQWRYSFSKNGDCSFSFSSDSAWLASCGYDNLVNLWELEPKWVRHSLSHQNTISSIAFSPEDNWLASGGNDKNVKLWALKSNDITDSQPLPISNFRPLNTVLEDYQAQQQTYQNQLSSLHSTQEYLSSLQGQLQTAQADFDNQQKNLDYKKAQFELAQELELQKEGFSADEQKQHYHQALEIYENTKQDLIRRQQQVTAAETEITKKQEVLRALAQKLDDLRRELVVAHYQQLKMQVEQTKVVEVREEMVCSYNMTMRECQVQAKTSVKRKAIEQGIAVLFNGINWTNLLNNDADTQKKIRHQIGALLLGHEVLDEGFTKAGGYFYQIRATVKGQVPAELWAVFL